MTKIFFIILLGVVAVFLDPIVRKDALMLPNNFEIIFQCITQLGDAIIGIPLIVVIIGIVYYRNETLRNHIAHGVIKTFITMLFGSLIINIGKSLVGRARPKLFTEFGAYYFKPFNFNWDYDYTSFPSGHTTTWGLLAFSCAVIFPRYQMLWIMSAVLVACSRVIVGAHYMSDVFFSLLLSYGIVYYCHYYIPCSVVDNLKKKLHL